MARQTKVAKNVAAHRGAKRQVGAKSWSGLTWDNLSDWAGSRSVSRGRSYQRQGRVQDLVCGDDGRLLATVSGTDGYITTVWLTGKRGARHRIDSTCTCPVGTACKHAVAVVAEYLAAIAEDRDIPVADKEERRWSKLMDRDLDLEDDFNDEKDNFVEADDAEFDDELRSPPRARGKSPKSLRQKKRRLTRADWDEKIKSHLEQMGQAELAALVGSLVERFPELRQEFQERIALGEGDADRLVAMARRELRSVTAEFGWRDHWSGDGHTPNFSNLQHRLERLLEMGYFDQVVELGRELISRGMEQVGQSDDEGETAMGLSDCLDVVFRALAKSSLTVPDKVLFTIDARLQDSYDVIGDSANLILDGKWTKSDWSVVADRLMSRLAKSPAGSKRNDFMRDFQRDCLSEQLFRALKHAGRAGEMLAIYEAEARNTGSYQRLVDFLIQEKNYDAARQWAREGIAETRIKYPGIASGLAKALCEMARREKQWDVVAVHAAVDFFSRPAAHTFKELIAAAKKAKCEKPVQAAALEFLETGTLPIRLSAKSKQSSRVTIKSNWPLPLPDYLVPLMFERPASKTSRPHFDVLIDMAIKAKRPDEVLRWYDAMHPASQKRAGGPHFRDSYYDSDRVAKAVADKYPQRALEIYRRKLDMLLRQTGVSAYENCAASLRRMRPIYKSLDQEDYWNELLADIRHRYKNRPRFMEILDQLEGRTIVQSHKSSRRR